MHDNGKCPVCSSELLRTTVGRLKNNKDFELMGYNYFCSNMNCRYERDTGLLNGRAAIEGELNDEKKRTGSG